MLMKQRLILSQLSPMQVSVSVSKVETQPAETVDVTVHASPQSTAFILAVDQSVLLLKSGNDITQGQVTKEMDKYHMKRGFYGGFAREIFEEAGMLMLSDTPQDYGPRFSPWDSSFERYNWLRRYSPRLYFDSIDSIDKELLLEAEGVRNLFPETWLWTNISVDASGSGNLTAPVPDTITSWVVSAFAVNPSAGFGVATTAAKLRVFRPFFAALNLPYSVTRGEQVVIQAVIFNYLDTDLNVRVTLAKSQSFQNLQLLDEGQEQLVSEDQAEDLKVPAGEGKTVYFPIVPTKLGFIDIEVSARSSVAADALRKTLLVEPEGVAKEFSVSVLVDLKTSSSFSQTVPVVALPPNLVPDSTRARITAIGDLMGPSVKTLDNLLKLPTGCGEQNMINLAPDVFIASYLNATNQLTGNISDKVVKFMESGYQRQLTYKRNDGSFSAFGGRDPSGSMWLTAFVVKTLEQAKPYIFIDDNVITRAVNWIVDWQDANGSFREPGRVLDRGLQGGSESREGLTAYVLISLLELQDLPERLNQSVTLANRKAVDYLKQRLPQISDDYVLALTTYALTLARDPAADSVFDKLLTTATISNGLRYWHNQKKETASSSDLWRSPQTASSDVLTTSYVLLTYTTRKDFTGGIDVMKWLALQRNPYGGFSSTQDTVLALQALSQYARFLAPGKLDMQVSVTAGVDNRMFVIDQQRALELQIVELPSVPSSMTVNATGSGIALISLSLFFNVKTEVEKPAFEVNVTLLKDEVKVLHIQACATWLANGTSGMAVQEVGIPSGFTADIKSISQHKLLKRTELRDKKVILYFDEIGAEPLCTTLEAKRTGLVAKSQPVPVRVYDYYRPENQATVFYKPSALESTSVCDICQECKCPKRK